MKKHTRHDDVDMEDTVEKNVAGLAEQIIQEDKARQAQELVRYPRWIRPHIVYTTGCPL